MTPDDEFETALRVVQSRLVSVRNAMTAATTLGDPEQRRRFQRLRIVKQLEMLEAARKVYDLGVRSPDRQAPPGGVRRLEEEWGFEPGTYDTTVEDPRGNTAVPLRQDLELAISVTRAELRATEPPATRPDFVAAVIRICCATVIGTLIGAPLGALAAQEDVLKKVAEAAVVVGLGATTAEVVQPISVKLTRGPETPAEPDVSTYLSVLDIIDDLRDEVERGALLEPPADFDRHTRQPEPPKPPKAPEPPGPPARPKPPTLPEPDLEL